MGNTIAVDRSKIEIADKAERTGIGSCKTVGHTVADRDTVAGKETDKRKMTADVDTEERKVAGRGKDTALDKGKVADTAAGKVADKGKAEDTLERNIADTGLHAEAERKTAGHTAEDSYTDTVAGKVECIVDTIGNLNRTGRFGLS